MVTLCYVFPIMLMSYPPIALKGYPYAQITLPIILKNKISTYGVFHIENSTVEAKGNECYIYNSTYISKNGKFETLMRAESKDVRYSRRVEVIKSNQSIRGMSLCTCHNLS